MSKKTIDFTDESFETAVIANAGTVLVDFWAPWCGPCRALTPVIEEIAATFDGSATIGKLNVDENPLTAQRYGITSIPTVLIFRDGHVVDQLVGMRTYRDYADILNGHLVEA